MGSTALTWHEFSASMASVQFPPDKNFFSDSEKSKLNKGQTIMRNYQGLNNDQLRMELKLQDSCTYFEDKRSLASSTFAIDHTDMSATDKYGTATAKICLH